MAVRPILQNGIPVIDGDPDGRSAEAEDRGDAGDGRVEISVGPDTAWSTGEEAGISSATRNR